MIGAANKGHKKRGLKILLIVLLSLIVLFSILSLVFVKVNFDETFGRTELLEYSVYLRYADVEEQYDRELLSFLSGRNRLQGYLYGADNTKGLVVLSHGLGSGAEGFMAETIFFVEQGYQVFSFDNTGCCRSEGKNCVGLTQSVLDLDAALSYIEGEERFDGLPILLYGHSWGGYAVTAIFHFDHDITASVSVAGFAQPMEMILEWTKDMMGGFAYVEYPYIYLYQRMLFGKNANLSAVDGINRTETPILLIHGSEDTVVGYTGAGIMAHSEQITNPYVQYKICGGEKQNHHNDLFRSLDAVAYAEEVDAAYETLEEQYGGDIPVEIEKEFCAEIDKDTMNELDTNFMQDVLAFYENAVDKAAE